MKFPILFARFLVLAAHVVVTASTSEQAAKQGVR